VNRIKAIAESFFDKGATPMSNPNSPMPRPKTTVQKGYAQTWEKRFGLIQQITEGNGIAENDLPRVLASVARGNEKTRGDGFAPTTYVAFDTPVELPLRPAQRLHRGAVTEMVHDSCTETTDLIVELGSGWGEHLFNIWLEGGPRNAEYVACEIEEWGRKCSMLLQELEPRIALSTAFFDYRQPDFSTLPKHRREAVVYSVQSVEQVDFLGDDLVTKMLGIADNVSGLHFEPVGWQMIPDADKKPHTLAHEERCRTKKYNENLWPLLQRHADKGDIEITQSIPNFFGHIYNPVSLIAWRKRK